jgi:hypothetical protein
MDLIWLSIERHSDHIIHSGIDIRLQWRHKYCICINVYHVHVYDVTNYTILLEEKLNIRSPGVGFIILIRASLVY